MAALSVTETDGLGFACPNCHMWQPRVGCFGGHAIRDATQPACGFPATSLRPHADAGPSVSAHPAYMRRGTYAVWWTEGNGPRYAGKLEVGILHVLLSGNGAGRAAVPLHELASVDYARGELTLGRRWAAPIRIGSLDAPGALRELTDVLAQTA